MADMTNRGWEYPDGSDVAEWKGRIKADGSLLINIPSVPVGTIIMYGGVTAPAGWLLCDGTEYDSAPPYLYLFNIIGHTFDTGGEGAGWFRVPDMRGIFPRGAGTNGNLTNANGTAFAGTLGTYQNDKMQGHYHILYDETSPRYSKVPIFPAGSTHLIRPDYIAGGINGNYENKWIDHATDLSTDGTNGTPRTGAETNPANLAVNFIIKY